MKNLLNADNDPILFDRDLETPERNEGARIIDFTAHRLGSVRRVLSHEVIYADDEDFEDELEFTLLAASGMRFR